MYMLLVTIKGVIRDRILQGIFATSLAFLTIPSICTLSMRQVTALALTLSLSLSSFVLLLLAIFLGSVSLWRDVERRYTHSVLSLPQSRGSYLLGRFAGIGLFLCGTAVILGVLSVAVVAFVSMQYPPDQPVSWLTVVVALGFDTVQSLILVAFAVLISSVSTSFFLPIFGTIAVYFVGGASQQAFDYVQSPDGKTLAPIVRKLAEMLYYVLPNLSAFDLKVNAIYSLPLDFSSLGLTLCYGVLYTVFLLSIAIVIYSRRELG